MLRFENVSSKEMPEVVRIASEMYEADQERERDSTVGVGEHASVANALDETGVQREYLERASQELHNRRVRKVKRSRYAKVGIVGAVLAAFALWGGWRLMHTPPASPVAVSLTSASSVLDTNPETKANISYDTV